MTDRNGKNIFDFLFEADEDMNELVREEEELEAEEAGDEEPEAPAGDVEPEVEDAFLSLGDALGLDVEVEGDADDEEAEDSCLYDLQEKIQQNLESCWPFLIEGLIWGLSCRRRSP